MRKECCRQGRDSPLRGAVTGAFVLIHTSPMENTVIALPAQVIERLRPLTPVLAVLPTAATMVRRSRPDTRWTA